eukprot:1160432-Pelagomonas_calceolata.AAC.6
MGEKLVESLFPNRGLQQASMIMDGCRPLNNDRQYDSAALTGQTKSHVSTAIRPDFTQQRAAPQAASPASAFLILICIYLYTYSSDAGETMPKYHLL